MNNISHMRERACKFIVPPGLLDCRLFSAIFWNPVKKEYGRNQGKVEIR
jgi:hypothetical protein